MLLAILAVARQVKSTLLSTYGAENLVHQLNAYCTTYTFCFISGPSHAANACKLGNLLCSKNYGQERRLQLIRCNTSQKRAKGRKSEGVGFVLLATKAALRGGDHCQPSLIPFSSGFSPVRGVPPQAPLSGHLLQYPPTDAYFLRTFAILMERQFSDVSRLHLGRRWR